MKILNIACGVNYSKIYFNLFNTFEKRNLDFEVYIPQHISINNKDDQFSKITFPYYRSNIIKRYDKLLYFTKIRRMYKDVETNLNLRKVKMIHAHSLFSDGGVAFQIYKQYKIPYIVAIRNTDVNKYFKYGLHLKKYAIDILMHADKIIFISPSYKEIVFNKYIPVKYHEQLLKKVKVIPNGIEEFWIENNKSEIMKKTSKTELKLLFLGRIDQNKNLHTVIEVVKKMVSKYKNCKLTVVGEGPLLESYKESLEGYQNIDFLGKITDKLQLREIYRNNDILIVPSITETFGLVYPESMSCGTPVIYTRNQGFDGFFKNGEVGYAVVATDVKDIACAIEKIKENYSYISKKCLIESQQFDWDQIVEQYLEIYI